MLLSPLFGYAKLVLDSLGRGYAEDRIDLRASSEDHHSHTELRRWRDCYQVANVTDSYSHFFIPPRVDDFL